jgi:hypothetical protein
MDSFSLSLIGGWEVILAILLVGALLSFYAWMIVIPTTVLLSYELSKIWTLGGRDLKSFALILVVVCLVLLWDKASRLFQQLIPQYDLEPILILLT